MRRNVNYFGTSEHTKYIFVATHCLKKKTPPPIWCMCLFQSFHTSLIIKSPLSLQTWQKWWEEQNGWCSSTGSRMGWCFFLILHNEHLILCLTFPHVHWERSRSTPAYLPANLLYLICSLHEVRAHGNVDVIHDLCRWWEYRNTINSHLMRDMRGHFTPVSSKRSILVSFACRAGRYDLKYVLH